MTIRRSPSRSLAMAISLALAIVGGPCLAPAHSAPTDRQMVQHLLRRFAFSAPPETIDRVLASAGKAGWLAAANAWLEQQIDATADVKAFAMEPPPSSAPLNRKNPNDYDIGYEHGYVEHSIGTSLQLQAKLELHWLDHFSVVEASTGGWTEMMIYDQLVRQNALGNFQTLLTAVSETPAELEVLSNDGNIGSNAKIPPNVNFAREVMQIFSIGPFQLNMDGSEKLDPNGQPLSNYSDGDILTLAYAMTGYGISRNSLATDPLTALTTTYDARKHYAGVPAAYDGNPLNRFMGQPFSIPPGQDPIAHVVGLLVNNPSAAPFQAKEMLQRFVTEAPSPGYVSRIASVWQANVEAPNQIAQVVRAIVDDPEFASSYHSSPKQPIETVFQFMRQLPGTFAPVTPTAGYATVMRTGAARIVSALKQMGQDPYDPETVFSFYPPGDVEAANTNAEYLAWMNFMRSSVTWDQTAPWLGAWIGIPTLRQRIAAKNGNVNPATLSGDMVAAYLLDAMLDGGSAGRSAALVALLGATPSDALVSSAIWLIAASPEFDVN